MVEQRERLRFACEPSEPIWIVGEGVGQELQRDVAIQLRVARAIHLAHAAFADLRGDFVDAEAGTGGEGQTACHGLYGPSGSADAITPE
jgi:hypothetical protein